MRPIPSLRRSIHRQAHVTHPPRLREPRGLVGAGTATTLLTSFIGARIGAADTSMDRLVVAISAEPMHLLVIAGTITFARDGVTDQDASVCHSPGSDEALIAMADVCGRVITDVRVELDGSLVIGHERGSMVVAADRRYEAWEIRGMDGGLLACLPGGAISLWAPTSP